MKNKFHSAVLVGLASAALAAAAPLSETTAVHTKPDESSPAISYLKAGSEPNADSAAMAATPAGWMAIDLPGPFEGYVLNRDLTKGLDVKPGTAIRLKPDASAAVLTMAEAGDKTSITGLHGKWTQISLQKPLVGYIHVGSVAGYMPPIATAAASSAVPPIAVAPATESPAPATYGASGPGQAVPAVSLGDSSSNLPRQFTGKFVSTRSVLHPRRPYDWALVDNSGQRYAYVDVSKLLLTDAIDKYVGHFVVVFGAAKPIPDSRDIVIQVESLQLLMR